MRGTSMRTIVPMVVAAALMAGCQNTGTGETVGTVGGAVAGGLVGAQFGSGSGQLVATGVGTLLGAFAGNQLGRQFDQQDHYNSGVAGQQAFASGETQTWSGPNAHGAVTPSGPSFYQNGRECRNFTQTVYSQGMSQDVQGVACRNPDGSWQVASYY